jgi:hypothetical protein
MYRRKLTKEYRETHGQVSSNARNLAPKAMLDSKQDVQIIQRVHTELLQLARCFERHSLWTICEADVDQS